MVGILVTAVALAAAVATPARAAPDLGAQLDALVSPHFAADQPGAAVLVRKGERILLRKGYGLADVERALPVRPELVFRLGSLTKQLTAAAIMILVDEGKLSVRDDIRKFLPSYPTHGATITVEHLLTHTSGIRGYTELPAFRQRMAEAIEPAALLEMFENLPLEFKPGERMRYSNSGYHLLGLIIEKVSGKRYADFVAERIFRPLGMAHSGYGDDPLLPRVKGYEWRKGAPARPAALINMKIPYAAGALVSSVDDLAAWDAAIAAGKLLRRESWRRVFTPPRLNDGRSSDYGYGWMIGEIDGRRIQRHGGGIPGFSTHILRMPDDKLLVAILCNSIPGPTDVHTLAHRLAMTALGKPQVADKPPAERPVISPAPEYLERFVGEYQLSPDFAITITREGKQLFAQATNQPRFEIFASAPDEFFLKVVDARLTFQAKGNQPAQTLVLHQNGRQTPGKRVR